jgi:hypothetical protein
MDWTAYCCSTGKSLDSALWTSPFGPRPLDPVPHGDKSLRVLFSGFSSILVPISDHDHGTSRKHSRGTQEPKNSWRTTSLAARVAEPLPSLPPGMWPCWGLGSFLRFRNQVPKGQHRWQGFAHFTSTTTVTFPLFAVGVFAMTGTLDRVGSTV